LGEEVEGAGGDGDALVEAAGRHVEVHLTAAEEEVGVAGDLEAAEAGEVGRAELLQLRVGRRRLGSRRTEASQPCKHQLGRRPCRTLVVVCWILHVTL
jgi:hypothetical protein